MDKKELKVVEFSYLSFERSDLGLFSSVEKVIEAIDSIYSVVTVNHEDYVNGEYLAYRTNLVVSVEVKGEKQEEQILVSAYWVPIKNKENE